MKKLLLILMLSFPAVLFAPVTGHTYLASFEPLSIYDRLISAIYKVETNNGLYLFNPEELARGPLQIRPIRLNDFNQRTGKAYTSTDCYDFEKAREIFLYYAKGKSFEWAAKSWNGSGSMTIEYWKKVKAWI